MDAENAIEVKDLAKKFKVFYDKGIELKDRLLFRKRNSYEDRWVLNGISFNVKKGEAVGLIGQNGCGKSTTLKLLTRIIYPDSGTIEMKGRVSSLIELGAGFHADMSGRENIYTNAAIFGLTKKEIDKRLDDIISFSELEEFIDNPVRTYSSGMYMRLAFSVAINVDADILLIDEILAVGDVSFQSKCFNKMREIKAKGTTIVIVSHDLGQIEKICDRAIWIQDGKIKEAGKPIDVDLEYIEFMEMQRQANEKKRQSEKERKKEEKEEKHLEKGIESEEKNQDNLKKVRGNGNAKIESVKLFDLQGNETKYFRVNDSIIIEMKYKIIRKVEDAILGIAIYRSDGVHCYGTNTEIDKVVNYDIIEDGCMKIELSNVKLLPGKYLLDVAIHSKQGYMAEYYREAVQFETFSSLKDSGVVRVEHKWIFDDRIVRQKNE